jgi:hypothetical protein
MNFTHLMPDHTQPAQSLLQQYSNYLLLVVLSDEMVKLALETTQFDMESTDDVLCQIVLPEHLELSRPGTMLGALKLQLYANRRTPNLNHSFIAVSTRAELRAHPPSGGAYYPLMLNTLSTQEEMVAELKNSMFNALRRVRTNQRSGEIAAALKIIGPAASLAATVYKYSHGIP